MPDINQSACQRRVKAPAKKEAPAPWEDKFEVQPGQESASEDDSSSSSSSSSSSGSSSSSSSSSRGSVAKSKEEVPDPVPAVRASQQRRLGKQQDTRIPFGKHWLTPRWGEDGAVVAYQATCKHVHHNKEGRCLREARVDKFGSADRTMRLLKSWIAFGEATQSKPDHKACFEDVAALVDFPSHADLDVMVSENHVFAKDPLKGLVKVEEPQQDKARKRKRGKVAADAAVEVEDAHDDLGGRHVGVPLETHAAALLLFQEGAIPHTTPDMRGRNRRVPGTTYYVQQNMHMLLDHGYIHPNLPPPRDFLWFCHSGHWWLQRKGG